MDIEASFNRVNQYIKDGRIGLVRPEVDNIADSTDDPFMHIKCASLLKVIDDENGTQRMLDRVLDNIPDDATERLSIAVALRSLNRPDDALDILEGLDGSRDVLREMAYAYNSAGDDDSAFSCLEKMGELDIDERILRTDVLTKLGRTEEAFEEAESILNEERNYGTLVNYCTILIRMDRTKEATKIARSAVREGKKDPESLAMGAYVMWIQGKAAAAYNLAHSALKIDHTHVGALETTAMCLIEKNRFLEAKIVAGAINDKEPGHPAAIRILDACRVARE